MDAVIALHYVKMLINNGTFYELAFELGWLSKLEEKNNYSCPKFLSYFVRDRGILYLTKKGKIIFTNLGSIL